MRYTMMVFVLALFVFPTTAAEPRGYKFWSASELKSYEKILAPRITASNKIAIEDRVIDYGNYFSAMVHREGNAPAEIHESWADLYVISSGTGTLEVGGTIPGGTATAPGEIRGASIQGGTRQKLSPGDVVHIPARTAHNVLVDAGGQITYFIFKVRQ